MLQILRLCHKNLRLGCKFSGYIANFEVILQILRLRHKILRLCHKILRKCHKTLRLSYKYYKIKLNLSLLTS